MRILRRHNEADFLQHNRSGVPPQSGIDQILFFQQHSRLRLIEDILPIEHIPKDFSTGGYDPTGADEADDGACEPCVLPTTLVIELARVLSLDKDPLKQGETLAW